MCRGSASRPRFAEVTDARLFAQRKVEPKGLHLRPYSTCRAESQPWRLYLFSGGCSGGGGNTRAPTWSSELSQQGAVPVHPNLGAWAALPHLQSRRSWGSDDSRGSWLPAGVASPPVLFSNTKGARCWDTDQAAPCHLAPLTFGAGKVCVCRGRGPSWAPAGTEQHPWPSPPCCQEHPQVMTTADVPVSPCVPQGIRTVHGERHCFTDTKQRILKYQKQL